MSAEDLDLSTRKTDRIEQSPFFSYEEMRFILSNFSNDTPTQNSGESEEAWLRKQQALIKGLLDKLLSKKEKFSKVFTTEKGSTYFVLDTGESFRIKKDSESGDYEIESIFRNVFFLEPQELEKLQYLIKERAFGLVETRLVITNLQPGVTPLEIGKKEGEEEASLRVEGNTLIITPLRKVKENIVSIKGVRAYHYGHPVQGVVKE